MKNEKEIQKEGLELVSSESLAALVEDELSGYGELRSDEARAAFAELGRRTPD